MPITNHPQVILNNPQLLADKSDVVTDDLALSSWLCKLRQQVDDMREQCIIPEITEIKKEDIKEKIKHFNNDIQEAIGSYDLVFKKIIELKLYSEQSNIIFSKNGNSIWGEKALTEEMLNIFYQNRIIRSTTFCNYQAVNNASLKTFLLKILCLEIMTFNKKIVEDRRLKISSIDQGQEIKHTDITGGILAETEESINNDDIFASSSAKQFELKEQQSIRRNIINEAIDCLSTDNQEEADLVRLWMQDVEYKDIAANLLVKYQHLDAENQADLDAEIEKTAATLRQQIQRAKNKLHRILTIIVNRDKLALDENLIFVDLDREDFAEQKQICDAIISQSLLRFSRKDPEKARDAAGYLETLSSADTILLFGNFKGKKITKGRTVAINALHKVVQDVLAEDGLEMTIERSAPIIKRI